MKKLLYYYTSFSGKAGRLEYGIYLLLNILLDLYVLDLNSNTNWNDETIINLFYMWSILLVTFVPLQAVTTRRMRDLKINPTLIVVNFIPIVNIILKGYLLFRKKRS